MLNPETHEECLQFIRFALSYGNPECVSEVAQVVSDVCKHGHAYKQAILDSLSRAERTR